MQLVHLRLHGGGGLRLGARGQDAQKHRAARRHGFQQVVDAFLGGALAGDGRAGRGRVRIGVRVLACERILGGAHRGDELVGAPFGFVVVEVFKWIEPVVVGFKRKVLVRGIVSHVPPLVTLFASTAHGAANLTPEVPTFANNARFARNLRAGGLPKAT